MNLIDRYPGDLDGRICSFIDKLEPQNIAVSVREIITYMLELYKRHGCQHQWLVGSGNFYNALCEFLRTRDCFEDGDPQPTVNVSFSASLSGNEPKVVGILKRYGPLMKFKRLDVFTSEEGWCEIRPSYTEPVLESGYTSIVSQPEYRLTSDWVKFDWDKNAEGFRGYVRPLPKMGDREVRACLNVDLATVSKRFFPTKVVFERHIRVRIQLSVCRTTNIRLLPSPDDAMLQPQKACPKRPLFHPLPGVEDLDDVMKAHKRSAASSPTKQKKKKKAMAKAPCFSPASPRWGRNVPAWETLPVREHLAEKQKDYDNSANDFEATDDEYIIIYQPHTIPSSCDLNGSDAPLEMKPTTKGKGGSRASPPKKTSHFNVTHYPGTSVSPEPVRRAETPVCPASAPPCPPRRRCVDSMFGINSDEKRPASSTVWVTLDEVPSTRRNSACSAVDDTTCFRWHDHDDGHGHGHGHDGHCDDDLVHVAAVEAGPSHVEEQAAPELYRWLERLRGPQIDIEMLRRDIRDWYDSMRLKQDTPCRKTKDDLSQEHAFEQAFLGGDSGEDGDAEGDD